MLAIALTEDPTCGDGHRDGSEACDDGNTASSDGCSSSCSVEAGWTCTGGSLSAPDTCTQSKRCPDFKRYLLLKSSLMDQLLTQIMGVVAVLCRSLCKIRVK